MREPEGGVPAVILVLARWWPVLLLLTGCASEPVKMPSVGGQNPAQGTVTLTYEYGPDEPRAPDWERAGQKALRYCREWGYDNVEVSSQPDEECKANNRYRRCTRYFISRTWQCRNAQ